MNLRIQVGKFKSIILMQLSPAVAFRDFVLEHGAAIVERITGIRSANGRRACRIT